MDANTTSKISSRMVFGFVAIGFGLLILLNNFGIIEAAWISQLWPLFFAVAGVLRIVQMGSGSIFRDVVGAALIVLGTSMTLYTLGLVEFSWRAWWPVLLIVLGFFAMFKSNFRPRHLVLAAPANGEQDASLDAIAVLGGCVRSVRSQNFRGGQITTIMGGCKIDLRDASIRGEALLDVFALWGGIELRVPTDWTVILQSTGILGGFHEKTTTPADSSKTLIIRGYAIMGGLEVKN